MIIRIAKWGEIYENNRTRELKRLDWVPIPNKMDGDGYTELMDHPNGAAHLGAWISIIQIASRCGTRGTLLRDGAGGHTAGSLSRISRVPKVVFDEALPRLLNIGWLELIHEDYPVVTEISHDAAEIPHDDAGKCLWKGMEGKGKELKGTEQLKTSSKPVRSGPDEVDIWFDEEFWPIYWRRVEKDHSRKIFRKHATSSAQKDKIVAAVKAHAPQYERRDPEHRPHAATWLNKKCYNDPPEDLTPVDKSKGLSAEEIAAL